MPLNWKVNENSNKYLNITEGPQPEQLLTEDGNVPIISLTVNSS